MESEAVIYILETIKNKRLNLLWSYVLDFEILQCPFIERIKVILEWKRIAKKYIDYEENILKIAKILITLE